MTKKCMLEMMECDKEFVDSEVLEAVQQRTDKIKIARMTKVEALRRKEMEEEEQARQRKEEQARQRKKEQEEQAPKARGKNKTIDDRMEDLKRYDAWPCQRFYSRGQLPLPIQRQSEACA